jgi:hypothetical protein
MSALRFTILASTPALLLTGCNGIFWGNLGVLSVTVGIFLGTVFLSKNADASRTGARSTASTAASTTPRT